MTTKLHPLVHAAAVPQAKRPTDTATAHNGNNLRTTKAAVKITLDPTFKLQARYSYNTILPAMVVKFAPKLNGVNVCCWWRLKGICVHSCKTKAKATHTSLPSDLHEKFASFLMHAYVTAGPPNSAGQTAPHTPKPSFLMHAYVTAGLPNSAGQTAPHMPKPVPAE